MEYRIIDNFLSDLEFNELRNYILPPPAQKVGHFLNWLYLDKQINSQNPEQPEPDRFKKVTDIELLDPLHDWYFSNELWFGGFQSESLRFFGALLERIKPLAVWRIQANFTVQQEKLGRSLFHIDYDEPNKRTTMTTSIFYVNTTNGPTILEDGTEIECIANRLVTYPYDTYHAGVLCTDQPYRIVINLNYFT